MKKRSASVKAADPLSSWAEGSAKSAIVQFVESVVEKGGKDYVPPEERIATFDNDGTLWVEYSIQCSAHTTKSNRDFVIMNSEFVQS